MDYTDEIIVNEQILLTAMKNADMKKMDQLIHENLLFTIPSGETFTKEMDMNSYHSGAMKVDEISSNEQQINLIGDNAVVCATITMKGKYLDYVIDGKFRFTRVWKLFNEGWRVIAGSRIQLSE